ncbi:MAG: YqeG family HAD IIIA-type phosphatase [Clostridia bacterium]|nr:YqeG family HAD IIIA-type phosphatase [Clostridia bacterium]
METGKPNYVFESVTLVTPEKLRGMGARAVGIDLDNTLVYDSTFKPREGAREWVEKLKEAGIPVIIVSNTNHPRAYILSKVFRIPYFAMSKKPHTKNLLRAAKEAGVPIGEFAMIGDQIFADVYAANECGAISVWVKPFGSEKLFSRHFNRMRARERKYCREHGIEYREIR